MKHLISKILLMFVSVVVLTLVQGTPVYAVSSVDEQFFDLLLADQSVTRNDLKPENMWNQARGNMQGQNIYLMMYNEIEDKPFKDAAQKLSSTISFPHTETGAPVFFSEEEWRQIYIADKTEAIQERLGVTGLAVHSYRQVMTQYMKEEIEHNTFVAELQNVAAASEIFSDGDLSNSGFDLLADLQITELILFGNVEESRHDSALSAVNLPSLPSLGNPGFTSTSGEVITGETGSTSFAITESGTPGTFAPADQSFADDADEFPPTSTTSAAVLYNPTGLHPSQCNTDNNIGDALDDYFGDLPNGNPFDDLLADFDDGGRPGSGGDSESGSDDDSGDGSETGSGDLGDGDGGSAEDDFNDVEGAEPHDWTKPALCNGVFCIEIKFVNNEDGRGTYKANDNCVACHMDFMLANMDTLLAKTLTPSKAPGNLLESGKCKKGFLGVTPNLNIYAVKKPIPTPPDNNVIFQSSNPFEDFKQQVTQGYETGNTGKVNRHTKHIVQFSDGRTTSSVLAEIDDATATTQRELDFNREMSLLQQEVAAKSNAHNDISGEIERFHTLISATQTMLTDINGTSCEALRGKKTCE